MDATSYELIYDRFLSKITDYDLAELADDQLSNSLLKFLKSAITDFKYTDKMLSNRDDITQQFNFALTDLEQEILAKYMIVHWITPEILRLENIRQTLGSRDFTTYSNANMLDKLTNLKKSLINEADQDLIYYYYST
ncbi:hypothetical protein [Paenibacillus sp. NAIST15-1]|uniref:hypothetical protein n=1 Tax=Paenibacillus sp. NAIST15-1 TaxID=1605994 RepID=UPI000868E154|nr:hypothetical protein [Paenibacillus sp. NAIST15-1]GAV11291.1 hypothetical protein PBN151_1218 [Paenibacillus sp. NAIST15-1]